MITTIIGIGVFLFIISYVLFKIGSGETGDGNKHFLLQLLLFFFLFFGIILLGKATLDSNNYCDTVVNQTVEDSVTNTTTYTYDYVCIENTTSTSLTFYKGTLWLVRIFALYLLIYFTYEVLKFIGWVVPGERD